ncbi:unnamed protein product [Prorocentrum cordatum]|uniref:Uncharacterized protein n=1 Tax=Prorocentrum cordatum TaxID=2364126 RepID=A0ABN9X1K1_9DINO|nr:unnamed protein product [Polarella glacialis]
MDVGQAWPLLYQLGAAASGAALGQFGQAATLAKQLEHCGPAPPPLPVELLPAPRWGLFVLGFATGVALTLAVFVAVALDLVRRGAVRFVGQPPAQPPQAAIACGAPQAGPAEAPAVSGAAEAGRAGRRTRRGPLSAMAAAAAAAVLDRGSAAWVHYGAGEHHARLVGAHVENDEYAVVTPDFDVFVEQLSFNSGDLEGVRFSASIDVRPRGAPAPGSVLYTFAPLATADISELLAEADQVANLERVHRGLPRLGEAARAPGGAAAVATPVPVVAPAPGGARLASAGGAWVLTEPLVGHDVGDVFTLPVGATVLGTRALVVIDGTVASLEQLAEGAGLTRWALAHSIPHRAVQLLATVDGLNVKNLVGVELPPRRITLHEEAVAENPEAPGHEGADHYLGISERSGAPRHRQRGGARPHFKRWNAVQLAAQEAVDGLNLLFGRDPQELSALPLREGAEAARGCSSLHGAVHRHLFSTIASGMPDHAQSGRASFRELAGTNADYEMLARAVEPCDPKKVPLPEGRVSPVVLTDSVSFELGRSLDLGNILADAEVAEYLFRHEPVGSSTDVRIRAMKMSDIPFSEVCTIAGPRGSAGPRRPLWDYVSRELLVCASLAPLLSGNFGRPRPPSALATDASGSGWGTMEAGFNRDEAGVIGRWNERWRHERLPPSERAPRRRAPAADLGPLAGALTSDAGPWDLDALGGAPSEFPWRPRAGFPEIPKTTIPGRSWKCWRAGRHRFGEPIGNEEGRAVIKGMRLKLRDPCQHHQRHLVLVDNFCVAHCFSRGRAVSFGLLQLVRRLAALSIATGSWVAPRWVPSEHNPADEPPRLFEGLKEARAALHEAPTAGAEPGSLSSSRRATEAAGALREGALRRAGRPAGKAPRQQGAARRGPAVAPSPAARPPPPSLGRRAQGGELSACELATVGAKGSAAYAHFENLFRERQRRRGRSTDDHGEMEVNLLDYLDELLAYNAKLTHAEKMVHGLLHSTLPGQIRDYPRLQRALKGCRKRPPPVSRMPLPVEVKSGICALLIFDGERSTALYVESVFAGSLRPGELLRAKVSDLVKPGASEEAALRWWPLVVAPEERMLPSKTQTFDDTVIFEPAADKLGVDASLYQLRHGKGTASEL